VSDLQTRANPLLAVTDVPPLAVRITRSSSRATSADPDTPHIFDFFFFPLSYAKSTFKHTLCPKTALPHHFPPNTTNCRTISPGIKAKLAQTTSKPRRSMDVLPSATNCPVEIPAILAVVLSFPVGCFAGELLEPTRPP
jgi:hypothetical protein